ncbi:carboxypeptidase-like regulatory domain-containing protein [Aporhodopirellula aestuarii]|uniref:Carboxypeptidase regulatory-like domain-containing protein n=1 Tax=Aporhodopirellula aestuarii TaxID=2950107 RepID=A0ABT0U1Q3_9BACT|nr:carboxypeptidase-like regulatory domain-containing protein [Aporhodopirellula aestuarii]MCM2370716.1 hypothetical protein [Aporhodopirellula aestuarii]
MLPAINAQEPAGRSSGDPSGRNNDGESEAPVSPELVELKRSIARLETKIDRLLEQPSEFTPIKVRIVDELGEPLNGFEVQLSSIGDVQAAEATGISSDDGIGLSRALPYGRYWMTLSGNGWHSRSMMTLEVGKAMDLTVVAPAADQVGELVLQALVAPDKVTGLPFGEWEVKGQNGGWGTRIVPEPEEVQESSNDWKTFPTVSDGIEAVAVVVEFEIKRGIDQPNNRPVTWSWRGTSSGSGEPHVKWLVQSNGIIRPLLKVTERSTQISPESERFQNLAPDRETDEAEYERSTRRERLGYHLLELGTEYQDQAAIAVPAGQIKLSIETIYGDPTDDVLQAIDKQMDNHNGQIWLHGVTSSVSTQWLVRLSGQSWDVSRLGVNKSVEVSANERKEIRIGTVKSSESLSPLRRPQD